MPLLTFKQCIFCYKEDETVTNNNGTDLKNLNKNSEICRRFCTVASRYYDLDPYFYNPKKTMQTKRSINIDRACSTCVERLESFCDIYYQYQYLRMQLDLRAGEILTVLEHADKDPKHLKLREVLIKKLEQSDTTVEDLDDFRNELKESIAGRVKCAYPLLNLRKESMEEDPDFIPVKVQKPISKEPPPQTAKGKGPDKPATSVKPLPHPHSARAPAKEITIKPNKNKADLIPIKVQKSKSKDPSTQPAKGKGPVKPATSENPPPRPQPSGVSAKQIVNNSSKRKRARRNSGSECCSSSSDSDDLFEPVQVQRRPTRKEKIPDDESRKSKTKKKKKQKPNKVDEEVVEVKVKVSSKSSSRKKSASRSPGRQRLSKVALALKNKVSKTKAVRAKPVEVAEATKSMDSSSSEIFILTNGAGLSTEDAEAHRKMLEDSIEIVTITSPEQLKPGKYKEPKRIKKSKSIDCLSTPCNGQIESPSPPSENPLPPPITKSPSTQINKTEKTEKKTERISFPILINFPILTKTGSEPISTSSNSRRTTTTSDPEGSKQSEPGTDVNQVIVEGVTLNKV